MKITWEPADIFVGLTVGAPFRRERWIVGYDERLKERPTSPLAKEHSKHYALISLADGMISMYGATKSEIATRLTENHDVPLELIPMLERELPGPTPKALEAAALHRQIARSGDDF